MISCSERLFESLTTGTMLFHDSKKVNFIGSVSFEGNHAKRNGGKIKFKDALSSMRGSYVKVAIL